MLSNFCVIAIACSFLIKDLLEIGSHLYINNICLKKYILATSENFQYDPYTDTGYFGKVSESEFITLSTLYNKLTSTHSLGMAQRSNTNPYAKFYWHGSIMLQKIGHAITFNTGQNAYNIAFAYDVGGTGINPEVIKNVKYHVGQIHVTRTYPTGIDKSCYNSVNNIAGYINRYSFMGMSGGDTSRNYKSVYIDSLAQLTAFRILLRTYGGNNNYTPYEIRSSIDRLHPFIFNFGKWETNNNDFFSNSSGFSGNNERSTCPDILKINRNTYYGWEYHFGNCCGWTTYNGNPANGVNSATGITLCLFYDIPKN